MLRTAYFYRCFFSVYFVLNAFCRFTQKKETKIIITGCPRNRMPPAVAASAEAQITSVLADEFVELA